MLAVIPCSAPFDRLSAAVRPFRSPGLRERTVLDHVLDTLASVDAVHAVAVVTDERRQREIETAVARRNAAGQGPDRCSDPAAGRRRTPRSVPVQVLPRGRPSEGAEVAGLLRLAGELAAAQDCDGVLVHGLTHALASPRLVAAVAAAVGDGAAVAVPGLPVVDSIKVVRTDGSGLIDDTVDRDRVKIMQSPWGFSRTAAAGCDPDGVEPEDTLDGEKSLTRQFLAQAHRAARDASCPVRVVPGEMQAIALVSTVELIRAELFHESTVTARAL